MKTRQVPPPSQQESGDEDGQPVNLEAWAMALADRPELREDKVIIGEWRPEVKLTRVVQQRGKMLTGMGIAVDKCLHLLPEETLFLLERAKLLVNNVTREELYELIELPAYLTYLYYKKLSHIMIRIDPNVAPHVQASPGDPLVVSYQAFPPNSRFSKRDPGPPAFVVAIARDRHRLPSQEQMEALVASTKSTVHVALVSDDGGLFPLEIHPHVPSLLATPGNVAPT